MELSVPPVTFKKVRRAPLLVRGDFKDARREVRRIGGGHKQRRDAVQQFFHSLLAESGAEEAREKAARPKERRHFPVGRAAAVLEIAV